MKAKNENEGLIIPAIRLGKITNENNRNNKINYYETLANL